MSNSLIIDGVFASEAIDSSGEVLSIEGADISDLENGLGTLNYEHRGDDAAGASANDIIGKVLFAKKVYGPEDCTDSRQLEYWQKVKLPLIYGIVRLFDGSGHPGAIAAAAIIRDCVKNGEEVRPGFSIEGTTLKRKDNLLQASICRRVALTWKPCNKSAVAGLVSDPMEAKKSEHEHPMFSKLNRAVSVDISSVVPESERMYKALEAGNYNAAPGTLTGGSALQREDAGLRNRVKAAVRDWDRKTPFKKFLKHRLPEASDGFIDRFADLVHDYTIKKAQKDTIKNYLVKKIKEKVKVEVDPKPPKAEPKAAKTKTVKAPKVQEKPAPVKAPAPPPPQIKVESEGALTIRGRPVQPNPGIEKPHFDENTGVLHTPRGSFPLYIPGRDKENPDAGQRFANILSDPKVEKFHDYAMENWSKVHQHLKAGTLPPEVVMHGVLFSQLSPNTPVPVQEMMYSVDADTILVTCDQKQKRIKDFAVDDRVLCVDVEGKTIETRVVALHDHGFLDGFEATFDDGYQIVCSKNHKFLTHRGMTPLWEIVTLNLGVYDEPETQKRWLAEPVRGSISYGSQIQGSQEGLFGVQNDSRQSSLGEWQEDGSPTSGGGSSGKTENCHQGMERAESRKSDGGIQGLANREPRKVRSTSNQCVNSYVAVETGASRRSSSSQPSFSGGCEQVAFGESRGFRGEYPQNGRSTENQKERLPILQDGRLASQDWDAHLGWGPDSLWGGAQAGGFRESEPQDLGGGGRVLPFLRDVKDQTAAGYSSSSRPYAQSRGLTSQRCDIDSTGRYLLQTPQQYSEARMGRVAYSDAPLASTGSLALRRIVRVRYVGQKHMYDLEVSHPKHNFLLPNGVVTSNSHLVDSMKATGADPRQPGFSERIKQDWLDRDQPQKYPDHSPEHWVRLNSQLRNNADSKTTDRKKGEISGFMLASNKMKNMDRYHSLHNSLVELVNRHRGDARSGVEELMHHKTQAGNWEGKRQARIGKGQPDIGPYTAGPDVPGLATKTGRYTYGMLGGGNVTVPDTHFSRYLFGLDKKKDSATIKHIRDEILWNPHNANIMGGIDRYYGQHHDAVKHMLQHPKWKGVFEKPEDAIFPAFWKNWVGIVPHEASRGMKTGGFNEGTDHRPFWDAIGPYLNKSESGLDTPLAAQTAKTHAQWVEKYGEMPALLMYFHYLVPQLLASSEKAAKEQQVIKFESAAIELQKADSITPRDLQGNRIPADQAPAAAPLPDVPDEKPKYKDLNEIPETVQFGGKTVKPGHGYIPGGKQMAFFGATPEHLIGVPRNKAQSWTTEDLMKIPRAGGASVQQYPEELAAPSIVSHAVHGVPEYTHHDDVRNLVDGLDFDAEKQASFSGINQLQSFWTVNKGHKVYVKANHDESDFDEPSREGLYHNLARDFFGMGKYVTPTGVVLHPRTGQKHAVIENVAGGEHLDTKNPEHKATMMNLMASGELHKMTMMNVIAANHDRHRGNFMMTPGGMKLIDHGYAFADKDLHATPTPDYIKYHDLMTASPNDPRDLASIEAKLRFHPEAAKWLQALDPQQLDMQMRRHGVPERYVDEARRRLVALQHESRNPKATIVDMMRAPFYTPKVYPSRVESDVSPPRGAPGQNPPGKVG